MGRDIQPGNGVEKGALGIMKTKNCWQKGLGEMFKEVWQGQSNSRRQKP